MKNALNKLIHGMPVWASVLILSGVAAIIASLIMLLCIAIGFLIGSLFAFLLPTTAASIMASLGLSHLAFWKLTTFLIYAGWLLSFSAKVDFK